MSRVPYAWALPAAAVLSATAEVVVPVVPARLLAVALTLLLAQAPLPARRPRPLLPRTPRSELQRHLDRRMRRGREAD